MSDAIQTATTIFPSPDPITSTTTRARSALAANSGSALVVHACDSVQEQIDCIKERLEEAEFVRLGRKLMMLAGQAAVASGQTEGMGIFEAYEFTNEAKKIAADARNIAFFWGISGSSGEYQRASELMKIQTLAGRLAVMRLVEHYDNVKLALNG